MARLAAMLTERHFRVSKRQVERDLKELAEIFPLECNDTGTPFGWRWTPGAAVDLPGMDVAQALSLHLVEEGLRAVLPASLSSGMEQRFRQAEHKLSGLAPHNALCRWQDKVRSLPAQLPLQAPAIDDEVLQSVHEALLADEQLDVGYLALQADAPAALRLHPLALVQRGPVSYLAATAWDYEDVRLYALHRMASARSLRLAARRAPDFDIDAWLATGAAHFGALQPIRLRARLSESLARVLKETPLADGQRISKGNRLDVQIVDSWELRWWLLSQGPAIEVLGPKALRHDTAAALREAVAQYDAPPTFSTHHKP